MPKLSDTALVLLSHAAKRETGCLLPVPKAVKGGSASAAPVLKQLLKGGLVAEQTATGSAPTWKEVDGTRFTLVSTTEPGLKAINAGQINAGAQKPSKDRSGPSGKKTKGGKPAKAAAAGKSKIDLLKGMLARDTGMTVAEASKATGWLPHSVRGFMSGVFKKKLGLEISSEKIEERGRVYRIVG